MLGQLKMKKNWMWWAVVSVLIVGILLPIIVLWNYFDQFRLISDTVNDWGSFGSLIGGIFTFLGAMATVATLLFLREQQKRSEESYSVQQEKHDEVVKKQLAAQTFEQYYKHRKIFKERLDDLAELFNNVIVFRNLDRVYNAIFENNKPINCEYTVMLSDVKGTKAGDLNDCIAIYDSINELLDQQNIDMQDIQFMHRVMRLQWHLGFEYIGEKKEGDIYYFEKNSGINIFNISEALSRIEIVLNSILFYSGNKELSKISHKGQGTLIRDMLYKVITQDKRVQEVCSIFAEKDSLLLKLYDLFLDYEHMSLSANSDLMFRYAKLISILSDCEEIQKLSDDDLFELTLSMLSEIVAAEKGQFKNQPKTLSLLGNMKDKCKVILRALEIRQG